MKEKYDALAISSRLCRFKSFQQNVSKQLRPSTTRKTYSFPGLKILFLKKRTERVIENKGKWPKNEPKTNLSILLKKKNKPKNAGKTNRKTKLAMLLKTKNRPKKRQKRTENEPEPSEPRFLPKYLKPFIVMRA